MASYRFDRTIAAPPEVVFDVLTDHVGYAKISPVRKVELEREGSPNPNGVGAIRVLHAVGPAIREEVTAYEAPTRFGYKALSGIPVKSHACDVTLHAGPNNTTQVDYRCVTEPKLPGSGVVLVPVVKTVVGQLLSAIAKESEKRAKG